MSRALDGDNINGVRGDRVRWDDIDDEDAAYEALPSSCRKLLQDAPMKLSSCEMFERFQQVGEQQLTREFHDAMDRTIRADVRELYGEDHPQAARPSHGR